MEGEVIIVAIDASKEITDYALQWAVCNAAKNMDSLILLALLPSQARPLAATNRTDQFLFRMLKKCGIRNGNQQKNSTSLVEVVHMDQNVAQRVNRVCVHMMRRLCVVQNKQVHSEVKIIANAQLGSVASEARKLEAAWVILDRRLKKEGDCCLKQLDCNIVIVDHAIPKIIRAVNPLAGKNLGTVSEDRSTNPAIADMHGMLQRNYSINSGASETSRSSLGIESLTSGADPLTSLSSAGKNHFHVPETSCSTTKSPALHLNSDYFREEVESQAVIGPSPDDSKWSNDDFGCDPYPSRFDGKMKSYSIPLEGVNGIENTMKKTAKVPARRSTNTPSPNWPKQIIAHRIPLKDDDKAKTAPSSPAVDRTSSIRRAVSVSIKHPPTPPPLCSVCKHCAPIIGKTPRKFSYREIEIATDGFSRYNLLAEGEYGSVFKGTLSDGLVVAVKQRKLLSAQGASEFCSEVELLSSAQHRNLVMLVGYCAETEWLLIYEFACNGSLDEHLFEKTRGMAWQNRMRVAIGSARGLRYLHEDCRVGCIVHRDFRPNNILLTHDFEPMVGDFGLARLQADGQLSEETRVIGAFGYLAPEYTETGLITEKADVYSFGVVLLELLSGIKATDFSRDTGKQFAQECGRPLLERKMLNEIIDLRLEENYNVHEVESMMYAATLCTSPKPEKRPRMSKVLRILEGELPTDLAHSCRRSMSGYSKQYLNNTNAPDTQMTPKLDHWPSSSLMHHAKQSPSRSSLERNNDHYKTLKTLRPLDELDVCGEYQLYLQGSLAKFIQNLNLN